jgi:hypothetical protein
MDRRDEARADRLAVLQDLLASPAWREAVLPRLVERLGKLDRKMRNGRGSHIEEIRIWQGQAMVLEQLVTDPLTFLRENWEG